MIMNGAHKGKQIFFCSPRNICPYILHVFMDWRFYIFETLFPIVKKESEENGGDFNLGMVTEFNQRNRGEKR